MVNIISSLKHFIDTVDGVSVLRSATSWSLESTFLISISPISLFHKHFICPMSMVRSHTHVLDKNLKLCDEVEHVMHRSILSSDRADVTIFTPSAATSQSRGRSARLKIRLQSSIIRHQET